MAVGGCRKTRNLSDYPVVQQSFLASALNVQLKPYMVLPLFFTEQKIVVADTDTLDATIFWISPPEGRARVKGVDFPLFSQKRKKTAKILLFIPK